MEKYRLRTVSIWVKSRSFTNTRNIFISLRSKVNYCQLIKYYIVMVFRSIQSKCITGGRLYSIHTADLGAGRPMTGPRAWRRSGLGLRGLTGAGAGASSYSSYSSAAAASASSPSSSSHLQHINKPVRTSLCISPLAVNE